MTINRFFGFVLCLAFFIPISSGEDSGPGESKTEKIPCWLDDDYWLDEGMEYPVTSQAAMLKTFLLPINLETPKADAAIRHAHRDFRFMAVGGFGVMVPEVDRIAEDELICRYGTRFIEGTSDHIEMGDHATLMDSFAEYARAYNIEMRRLLGHAK